MRPLDTLAPLLADVAPDGTIPQRWSHYTAEEHARWDMLFARHARLLADLATPEYLRGMEMLRLSQPGIPNFDEL